MVKRPLEDFWNASHNAKPKQEAEIKDPRAIRDKDNADLRPKPDFAKRPELNRAPPGMSGIHLSRYKAPQFPSKHQPDKVQFIVKTHPKPELLTGGRFLDKPDCGFAIEVNPYRSLTGIENGKITTMEIQQEGKIVAQYQNMRWTVMPKNAEHKELVGRLQDQFGEPCRDFSPIVPVENKDHGHER